MYRQLATFVGDVWCVHVRYFLELLPMQEGVDVKNCNVYLDTGGITIFGEERMVMAHIFQMHIFINLFHISTDLKIYAWV